MICYALRYAREDISEKVWKEVYGILIGSIEKNDELSIKDAIPMIVGDRAGVKYENKQYVDMAQIDESIYEKSIQDKKKDFIVGWWHTHPGFKFMFSDVDIQTQLGYQIPNPLAIGLIFNHTEIKSTDFYLGLAALRIINPDQGILATYDYVDIKPEFEKEKMVSDAMKEVLAVKKNINKVIKELNHIDQILRKRYLAQLQRNYGLVMVPKDQIRVTDDPDEAEDDERILYEWNPEYYKKRYRVPKFREKIEKEIDSF
jgi:proteasome lid subunit RPN8/RPN11